jgi:hypothetical protein
MDKDPTKSPAIVQAENQLAAQGIRAGSQMGFKEAGRVVNPASSANFSNEKRDQTAAADIASDQACDALGVRRGSTWAELIAASQKKS